MCFFSLKVENTDIMSKIENYDEVSKSYDSTRGATDAYIVKGMMENFTGKTVKVRYHRVHVR